MKKIRMVFVLFCLVMACNLYAQPPAAIQLANRIADKMKDTLVLTMGQRGQIYAININLHNQKMQVRQQTTNLDSLRVRTQRVESKRDSLYRTILPDPKYVLYLQKKRYLVTAN